MRYLSYINNDTAANSPIRKTRRITFNPKLKQRINKFINDNAESIRNYAINNYEYDVQWANPALNDPGGTNNRTITATTDAAAIMALLANN